MNAVGDDDASDKDDGDDGGNLAADGNGFAPLMLYDGASYKLVYWGHYASASFTTTSQDLFHNLIYTIREK